MHINYTVRLLDILDTKYKTCRATHTLRYIYTHLALRYNKSLSSECLHFAYGACGPGVFVNEHFISSNEELVLNI
jgi:hypothetical protein